MSINALNSLEYSSGVDDARLLIRWAGMGLSHRERAALEAFASDVPLASIAPALGLSRGGVWMAYKSGLRKMKRRLAVAGIRSTADLLGL